MALKYKIIICVVALAISFACGRYSITPAKVEKIAQVNKEEVDLTAKDTHKVTVSVKKNDGTVITKTTEDIISKVIVNKDSQSKTETIITPQKPTINVSALVGLDPLQNFKPMYGASISKQILGPVTIGAFGLTNGIIGISLGLNF